MALPLAATTMNLSYHFFTSTMCLYAQHAWITLQELGVDYEMVTLNYKTSRKTFLSLSIHWQT
jgi:glutathione S-transferase